MIPIVPSNDFTYIYLISNFWVGSGLHSIPSGTYAKFCCDYNCFQAAVIKTFSRLHDGAINAKVTFILYLLNQRYERFN